MCLRRQKHVAFTADLSSVTDKLAGASAFSFWKTDHVRSFQLIEIVFFSYLNKVPRGIKAHFTKSKKITMQ